MKRFIYLPLFAVLAAFGLVLISCGDDDDGGGSSGNKDFMEVTIDGVTKRSEKPQVLNIDLADYKDADGKTMRLSNTGGWVLYGMGDICMPVAVYEKESDLKAMKTGPYPIKGLENGDDWLYQLFYEETKTPFETYVNYTDEDDNDYYASEGTVQFNSITYCKVEAWGRRQTPIASPAHSVVSW